MGKKISEYAAAVALTGAELVELVQGGVNVRTTTGAIAALGGGGAAQGINRIINGAFNINQRAVTGTVVLAAGIYGHDRWKAGASGCTYTFATSANVTTITITAGSLVQVIEGLNLQSGTHVLSWSGTAQGKIGAGSFGASGITGAATGGANLNIEFGAGTLSIVQLERGSVATGFEYRLIGDELALCQRYYWRGLSGFAMNFNAFQSGAYFSWLVSFPVTLRAVPVFTNSIAGITYYNAEGLLWDFPSESCGRIILNSTATAINCNFVLGANDYLAASAEL